MTRGILIAGNESSLTSAIEVEAVRRVEQYTLALIPDRLSGGDNGQIDLPTRKENFSFESSVGQASVTKARIPLDWNPGSPISARTLVIAAENRLGHIDEAILVCDPPSVRCAVADLELVNVEVLVNDHVKGWFFLVKELAAVFKARGKGTLALVCPETGGSGGKDDAADLLGQAALAAFGSFTRSLLAAASADPYFTMGFSSADAGDEPGFAAFIFKQLDENNRKSNGKLHKYGKIGFFR
jgi:NAD(P)-dependent dehydrogenase (short-subunit alcohol dehydrogenase family)